MKRFCPHCDILVPVEVSIAGDREIDRCARCQLRLDLRADKRAAQPDGAKAVARIALLRKIDVEGDDASAVPPPAAAPDLDLPADAAPSASAERGGDFQTFEVATALLELGVPEQAGPLFLLITAPTLRAEALHLAGACALQTGDLDGAKARFCEALGARHLTEEARVWVLFDLATVCEAQGEIDAARRTLHNAGATGCANLEELHMRLQRLGR